MHDMVKLTCEMYQRYNLKSQPYIVFCGSLHDVTCHHVVIDQVVYDCANPMEALDLCYKFFHVLRLNYNFACPHLWSFVQKFIYEMSNEKIVQSTKIAKLTGKLKKIKVN